MSAAGLGYAGVDNPFYKENNRMLFGERKELDEVLPR